jgi:hypothetical protein
MSVDVNSVKMFFDRHPEAPKARAPTSIFLAAARVALADSDDPAEREVELEDVLCILSSLIDQVRQYGSAVLTSSNPYDTRESLSLGTGRTLAALACLLSQVQQLVCQRESSLARLHDADLLRA